MFTKSGTTTRLHPYPEYRVTGDRVGTERLTGDTVNAFHAIISSVWGVAIYGVLKARDDEI